MEKYLAAIIYCLVIFGAISSYANDLPEFPFVFAEGKGKVEISPDIARISFRVEAYEPDSSKALEKVNECCSDIVAYFSSHNIKKEDVVSYELEKSPVREMKEFIRLNILGYEVSRRFSVTLRDLSLYEQLIKKLISTDNVVGFKSEFDRTDRKEIESRLLAQASLDAKEQAEFMAKGFGVQLGSIFAISQEGFSYLSSKFETTTAGILEGRTSAPKEEVVLFVPSTITLQSTVSTIFKLQEK